MSATFTTVGTFTPLATNLVPYQDTVAGNQMIAPVISQLDLATLPDEVHQMILNFQAGWGAALGTNARLGYWATVALLQKFLTNYINTNQ